MVVWRCPHCATPQAEAARCWVCHRSTTSCASCRHFRRSVASGLGICGLDPRRAALTGAEMRDCWTAPAPLAEEDGVARHGSAPSGIMTAGGRAPRTFVPVDELVPAAGEPARAPLPPTTVQAIAPAGTPGAARWSLWDDAER